MISFATQAGGDVRKKAFKSIKMKSKLERVWWCEKLCWWMENLFELSSPLSAKPAKKARRKNFSQAFADCCQHLPQTKQWTHFPLVFLADAIWKKNYFHSLSFQLVVACDMFTSFLCFVWRMKFPVRSPSPVFFIVAVECVYHYSMPRKSFEREKATKKSSPVKYTIFYEALMRSGNISTFFSSP
jgi:hypothetical protein